MGCLIDVRNGVIYLFLYYRAFSHVASIYANVLEEKKIFT